MFYSPRREKPQLIHRLSRPLIHHVLAQLRAGEINATQAGAELQLGRSRFYQLYSEYLRACASGTLDTWLPGSSGGDHQPPWPDGVEELLRKRLTSKPPCSYAFAAEEVHRVLGFRMDRATVRRFALAAGLVKAPATRQRAPTKRWQRDHLGELWQLDASPHCWFPQVQQRFTLLNLLDDCSRWHLQTKLYASENLLAYLDLLAAAFVTHGLPLQIYVDYHSLFFSHTGSTQLANALNFYGVSFRYAPTPQAKGKIERDHQTWQNRLPALFASESVTALDSANQLIDQLRAHRNLHEKHRELAMTPKEAWDKALLQKRSVLRPVPTCPWWPFVWSHRSGIQVGPDRRLRIGDLSIRVELRPGTWLILCTHPSGHYSVLKEHPKPSTKPAILFTNLPK